MVVLDILLRIIRSVIPDFKLPENIEINDNNLSVEISLLKIERPVTVNVNQFVINADSKDGLKIAQEIFTNAETLLNKGNRAIEKEFSKLIGEATAYSTLDNNDVTLINKIKAFAPPTDIPIISASLFIRRIFRNNGHVGEYKALLYQKYGARGNNISNLITADYYEDYLLPFYKQLIEAEGDLGKSIFAEIYEEAVTQYPFAVFVSSTKEYEQIKEEVIKKIQLNSLSGLHVLNIHGIGVTNKKTINNLLNDKNISIHYLSQPDVVEFKNTIYVRIYF